MDTEGSLKALSFGDPFVVSLGKRRSVGLCEGFSARMRAENFFVKFFIFLKKALYKSEIMV